MRTALFKLHASVFLAGFTGVLGKVISLSEVPLVWWRMLFVAVILQVMLRLRNAYWRPGFGKLVILYGMGGLLALTWILFYGSVKAATVSVALVCVSTMGFFTAAVTPLILKTPLSPREFLYSAFAIAGIGLIFHFDTQYRLGITLGCLSAALGSLYVILNKKYASHYPDQNLVFLHEICGGFALITLYLVVFLSLRPETRFVPNAMDLIYLLILAGGCTVGMYVLQLQALQVISPFTVNLTFNLEPVYSIILAALLLDEGKTLTSSFFAGLGLILFSVALQSRDVIKNRPRPPPPGSGPKSRESVRKII